MMRYGKNVMRNISDQYHTALVHVCTSPKFKVATDIIFVEKLRNTKFCSDTFNVPQFTTMYNLFEAKYCGMKPN